MTTAQKIIKYLAIALAIFLIVTIVSAILSAFYALSGVIAINNKSSEVSVISSDEMQSTTFENSDVAVLNINVAYANLTIKTGEYLKAETNNKNINCKQNNRKLEITQQNSNWFYKSNNEELIVYIPKNMEFEKVDINTGAGKVDIETLTTKTIEFKLGAGNVEINNLNVSEKARIEGGAGKLEVLTGEINDLDFDMGIGQTNISSRLTGKTEINAGVGSLNVNLNGNKEEYKIKASKGLGSIRIDGKEIADNETYGNGENHIKVDGGVGSINIKF